MAFVPVVFDLLRPLPWPYVDEEEEDLRDGVNDCDNRWCV